MAHRKHWAIVAGLMCIAAMVFLPGINWGLPTRAADRFLFGDHPVWTGAQIDRLATPEKTSLGADVDANPIARGDTPIVLNETDAQRADIIRRYRLYSYQPDEMITFRSLSLIRQFNGDPRLYQYGGLWIYPVGAMLGVSHVIGFVDLRGGPHGRIFYLEHPEAFGQFYVVARFYSAMWGIIGVAAVYWLAHRVTKNTIAACAAALTYAFMPVVVNMAHEAKPHLPGAVLMLLAVVAATKYVETGRRKWCLVAGGLCGAAFGMVISALLVFAILPVMVMRRCVSWRERLRDLALAGLAGVVVHAVTNPFVWINAIFNRELLRSNLSNSTAMYRIGGDGLINAVTLLAEGMSPFLAGMAIAMGLLLLVRTVMSRRAEERDDASSTVLWLLAAPAALVAVQFVLLAAEKPGEYARFALYLDITLAIIGVAAVYRLLKRPAWHIPVLLIVLVATGAHGLSYTRAFLRDASAPTTRLGAARALQVIAVDRSVATFDDPAPYNLPPVNLFDQPLLLLPRRPAEARKSETLDAIVVEPVDLHHQGRRIDVIPPDFENPNAILRTPISWADKYFAVEGH